MSRLTRLIAPVLVAFSVLACSDVTTSPPLDRDTQASIDLVPSSQPSTTVPGFYFLVPTLDPPPATFSGSFDAGLSPVIDICTLASDNPISPAACTGPKLATLNASSPPPQTVTLDAKQENYNANWSATVTAGARYRAFVSAGGRVLGYVDLFGVKKQRDAAPTGFVAVVAGKPFLFKFRIETGIASSIVVTPATATLRDADTPDQSHVFTASVLDLHGAPLANATVDWSASNAALVSLSPTSMSTDGTGQASSTASTTGRVNASTGVVITASLQGISGTAVLTVRPTDGRPIAVTDAYGVVAGKTLVVAAPGVLGNDLDLDGDPLTVASVTDGVDHGVLVMQPNGSFTYTPEQGYIGADEFTYTAVDATGQVSFPATVAGLSQG